MKKLTNVICGIALAGFSLSAMANQVNLNTASKDELLSAIKGLSTEQADAIIQYREEVGAFVKIPQLLHVGVDRDVIEPNYNNLTVGDATGEKMKNWSAN